MDRSWDRRQRDVCEKYHTTFVPCSPAWKVGIARNVREGVQPLNGLRLSPEGDTSGWYIWAGTAMSPEPDFFVPLHADHLETWCPLAVRFLGLPAGWRFLAAHDGYEDVWADPTLLSRAND